MNTAMLKASRNEVIMALFVSLSSLCGGSYVK